MGIVNLTIKINDKNFNIDFHGNRRQRNWQIQSPLVIFYDSTLNCYGIFWTLIQHKDTFS
jgi:N-methylhydantoinase B/oxoprolinase/acetone carboxylase alpha subunit